MPSQVKGAGLRLLSRRGSWVRIPPSAPSISSIRVPTHAWPVTDYHEVFLTQTEAADRPSFHARCTFRPVKHTLILLCGATMQQEVDLVLLTANPEIDFYDSTEAVRERCIRMEL